MPLELVMLVNVCRAWRDKLLAGNGGIWKSYLVERYYRPAWKPAGTSMRRERVLELRSSPGESWSDDLGTCLAMSADEMLDRVVGVVGTLPAEIAQRVVVTLYAYKELRLLKDAAADLTPRDETGANSLVAGLSDLLVTPGAPTQVLEDLHAQHVSRLERTKQALVNFMRVSRRASYKLALLSAMQPIDIEIRVQQQKSAAEQQK
jgi:hypothetical protein